MATTPVYDFPREWYGYIVTQKMRVRSASLTATRAYIGANSVKGPHAQYWLNDVTMAPIALSQGLAQDMAGFFGRLGGQAGLLRMGDSSRLNPLYDRLVTPTTDNFTDGTRFTDGTGFADGYLPPEVFIYQATVVQSNYIVLGGFPASTPNVLRRGDLFQIRPAGVDATVPHLYSVMFSCSSDSSGRVGIEISPRLRTGVNAGDPVKLRYASSVFRLLDDTQAEIEIDGNGFQGNFGFSLVEALDMVP